MRKLLPVLLALIGIGAGAAAGLALRPHDPAPEAAETSAPTDCLAPAHSDTAEAFAPAAKTGPEEGHEYVRMSNQFVVPVVTDSRVASLVVMSLSIEVEEGISETVFVREPKLRDGFLQVMFDHANVGGFSGNFTDAGNLRNMRNELRKVAQNTLGPAAKDVLITEIARQDN